MVLTEFNIFSFFTIFATLLCFYPLGKALGANGLFTGSIVGLSFAAVPISICAYFIAGLIQYLIPLEILFSFFIFIIMLKQKTIQFQLSKRDLATISISIFVAILLYLTNDPSVVFYTQRGDQIFLGFNSHYSYYSIQSIEMLNADYFSRLKVANMFPFTWAKYHFHTSSVFAAIQYFLPTKSLQSYFMAQFAVFVFIFLSFIETVFKRTPLTAPRLLLLFCWIPLGLSVLFYSIVWHISTTGIISIFAFFHLTESALRNDKNRKDIFLYATLLGVSAIRLVPISMVVFGYFFESQTQFLKNNLGHLRRSFIPKITAYIKSWSNSEKLFFSTLLLYVAATTLSSDKNPEGIRFFESEIYSDAWSNGLFVHKLLNFSLSALGFPDIYSVRPSLLIFEMLSENKIIHIGISVLLIIGTMFLTLSAFKKFRSEVFPVGSDKKYQSIKIIIAMIAILLSLKLSILTAIYISMILTFLHFNKPAPKTLPYFFLSLVLTAYFFQYTGANEIKSPVLTLIFDGLLWILPLLILLKKPPKFQYIASILIILLVLVTKNRFADHLMYPTKFEIEVTEVSRDHFIRQGKIDSSNFLLIKDSPPNLEALSAVTGSRLHFIEEFTVFRNSPFTNKTVDK